MPSKKTLQRARRDRGEGKSPGTQAGEFVREEIHHVREGKHGARSTQQVIAIALSKARRSGIRLKSPKGSRKTRGQRRRPSTHSARRSRASLRMLKREGHRPASHGALSKQAKNSSRLRKRRRQARGAGPT